MLSCLQVNITRMDQQKWKRELDDEARRKEKEEDDKENAHQNKPKGEGKAKTKPKSKAKKSPKEKDTKKDTKKDAKPTPTAKSAKAKAKPKTKPEPPPADAEAEMKTPVRKHVPKGPSPTGLQKRKSAAALEPGDHVTPPKESNRRKRGSGEIPKTFARRYKPSTSWGGFKWEALHSVFQSIISIRVKGLSKHEARFRNLKTLKTNLFWSKEPIKFLGFCRKKHVYPSGSAMTMGLSRRTFGTLPPRSSTCWTRRTT